MTLPLDGERLIPDAQFGSRDHRDHMARYELACALVDTLCREYEGREDALQVLDIACGEGYGTAMLERAGADAWGADISPRVVAHAKEKYGLATPNQDFGLDPGTAEGDAHATFARSVSAPAFFLADVLDLPWGWGGKFDLVVCMETIEHVEDWESALASLERVRAPGGFLVISTPNKGVYGAGNPYHKREHTRVEFEAMLRERYRWVQVMSQVEVVSSMLVAHPSTAHVRSGIVATVDRTPNPMYSVAVCGDAPIDVPSVALA